MLSAAEHKLGHQCPLSSIMEFVPLSTAVKSKLIKCFVSKKLVQTQFSELYSAQLEVVQPTATDSTVLDTNEFRERFEVRISFESP